MVTKLPLSQVSSVLQSHTGWPEGSPKVDVPPGKESHVRRRDLVRRRPPSTAKTPIHAVRRPHPSSGLATPKWTMEVGLVLYDIFSDRSTKLSYPPESIETDLCIWGRRLLYDLCQAYESSRLGRSETISTPW